MSFIDRILTIVITATLTSAVWIVAGGSLIELASDKEGEDSIRPAEAAPSPTPTPEESGKSEKEGEPAEAAIVEEGQGEQAPEMLDTDVSTAGDDNVVALRIPVLNVRASDLTDTFLDEHGGDGRLHEAIDIMAPEGTSVVGAAPGIIEKLIDSAASGKSIYVRSADGRTIHQYAHLAEYAEGLREGQRIRRGQRLGTVGSSGNASPEAPHLHFAILRTTPDAEWWEPANAVNPYPLLTK